MHNTTEQKNILNFFQGRNKLHLLPGRQYRLSEYNKFQYNENIYISGVQETLLKQLNNLDHYIFTSDLNSPDRIFFEGQFLSILEAIKKTNNEAQNFLLINKYDIAKNGEDWYAFVKNEEYLYDIAKSREDFYDIQQKITNLREECYEKVTVIAMREPNIAEAVPPIDENIKLEKKF